MGSIQYPVFRNQNGGFQKLRKGLSARDQRWRKRREVARELVGRLIEVVGEPTELHSDAGPICPAQGLRTGVGIDWFEADRAREA